MLYTCADLASGQSLRRPRHCGSGYERVGRRWVAKSVPAGGSQLVGEPKNKLHVSKHDMWISSLALTSPPKDLITCNAGPIRPSWIMIYLEQVNGASTNIRGITYAEAARSRRNAKYIGLKSTTIASFHPSTTSTPYIQYGIWATLDTVLRLAST